MVKNPPANAGVSGLTHAFGRSPGEGNGPDRGAWTEDPHGQRSLAGYSPWAAKSRTLGDSTHTHTVHVRAVL